MSINGPQLSDQTALVTDGGQGIGRAVALALSACGVRVAVVSASRGQADKTSRVIEEAGGAAWPFPADLSDISVVPDLVGRIRWRLGSAEILVSTRLTGPLLPAPSGGAGEITRPPAEPSITMALAAAMLPGMLSRGWGRIVNLAGWAEGRAAGTAPDLAPDPSAAAVETAVAGLAAELAGTGVTANTYWLSGIAAGTSALEDGMTFAGTQCARFLIERIGSEETGLVGVPVDLSDRAGGPA
jgi:3-oxoacyl-[acyl-carrier protein] reductase